MVQVGGKGQGNIPDFRNAVTLAATFDRELASQYGKALGEEFAGSDVKNRSAYPVFGTNKAPSLFLISA